MTFNIEALKAMGVDLKVSKDDVINLVVEQYEEQLEAELEEALNARRTLDLNNQTNAESNRAELQQKYEADKRVIALIKALEGVGHKNVRLHVRDGYYGTSFDVSVAYVKKDKYEDSVYIATVVMNEAELQALKAKIEDLNNKQQQLKSMGKKVKRDLVRAILETNSDGKNLLAVVDKAKSNLALPAPAAKPKKAK